MPRPRPQRVLLPVPFSKGLSQIQDPRITDSPSVAHNVVASKAGILSKAPGFALSSLPALAVGKSLAQNRGNLLAIGSAAVGGQSRDLLVATGNVEGSVNGPAVTIGSLPETRAGTPFIVSSGELTYASSDMGAYVTTVAGQYLARQLYVFEAGGEIYASIYSVDASGVRYCLLPTQKIPTFSALSSTNHAGKVTVCGALAVVTCMGIDPAGIVQPVILASTIDLSLSTFTSATFGPVTAVATTNIGVASTTYPYGVSRVDDDLTSYLLIYQGLGSGHSTISVSRVAAINNFTSSSGVFVDSTWAADGYHNITGFAIRGDTNGAYFAYGYNNSSYFVTGGGDGHRLLIAGTPAVFGGGLAMPGLGSSICSPINLYGGSSTQAMPPGPQLLDIKLVAGTSPAEQQVVWSPGPEPSVIVVPTPTYSPGPSTGIPMGLNRLGNTPPALPPAAPQGGCPYAAIYQSIFYSAAGTGTYGANSFRWTNGVTLASKLALVTNQTPGVTSVNCYVLGYLPSYNWTATVPAFGTPTTPGFPTTGLTTQPGSGLQINIAGVYPAQATNDYTYFDAVSSASTAAPHTYENIQGSFYLFSLDTFGNTTTAQATFNGTITGTNVPMRWVCSVAPRQALSQVPITTFVLPHLLSSTPNAGATLETLQPISSSVTQNAIGVVPVNLAYSQQYQSAELGGLTGLATGIPSLTDGQNIEEFAYPYYPESIQADVPYNGVQSAGNILSGTYQYMFTFERIDATGAVHRSGRSIPITVTVPTVTLINNASPTTGFTFAVLNSGNPFTTDGRTATFYDLSGGNRFTSQMASAGQSILFNTLVSNVLTPIAFRIVGYINANTVILEIGSPTLPASFWNPAGAASGYYTAAFQSWTIPMAAQVTFHVPTMGYSLSSGTNVCMYRTLAQGSTFYFNQATPNSVTASYVDMTDVTYDGDLGLISSGTFGSDVTDVPPAVIVTVPALPASVGISTNPEIYGDGNSSTTPGAILDNLTPPSFDGMITHKNRWWGFQGANVWYSKALTTGEGLGFNEEQALSIDDGPGPVTALASQDERLHVFKADRLFYVSGDGPDDTGSNNDLQPPQRVVSDVGCINPLSIVTGPMGTWFQSTNGLYLLNRKMMVEPAGKAVEDVLAQYPVITGSALDAPNGRILWTANGSTNIASQGIVIQYDYVLDLWTTRAIVQGDQATYPTGIISLPTSAGAIECVQDRKTGALFTESASYSVNGTYGPGSWVSPWIKAEDLQGFAHWWMVNLMWQNNDPHALSVSIAYDYATNPTDSDTVTAAQMTAATTPQMQWRFQPSRPKSQAIQVSISDAQDLVTAPTTFAGPTLLSLVVEYGVKSSRGFVPVSQRN